MLTCCGWHTFLCYQKILIITIEIRRIKRYRHTANKFYIKEGYLQATKAHFFEKTYFFNKLKMERIGDNNDDRNWLDEIALKEAIIGLDDREKNILKLRFFRGETQVEVAQEIGISQAQVSRLEKGVLGKIKKAL